MPISFLLARIGPLRLRCPLFALALGLAAPSAMASPQEAPPKPKSGAEAKVQATPKPVQSNEKVPGIGAPKLPEPKRTTKRTTKRQVNSEEEAQKHLREREASKHAKPKKARSLRPPPPHPPTAHPGVPK